ncbi:MAG: response regulator [Deferribacteraceae bacterium]|jgi:ActR/RegA family two-component response regulator|nr:response regulator [Deferribacteraceae bacterium]
MNSRVLLIDDSSTIHKIVDLTIDKGRFAFSSAYTSEEGLTLARVEKPDIILVNNKLFGDDPLEYVSELRRGNENVGIILLVGAYEEFLETELANLDIQDYLVKPFNAATLNHALKMIAEPAVAAVALAESVAADDNILTVPDVDQAKLESAHPIEVDEVRDEELEFVEEAPIVVQNFPADLDSDSDSIKYYEIVEEEKPIRAVAVADEPIEEETSILDITEPSIVAELVPQEEEDEPEVEEPESEEPLDVDMPEEAQPVAEEEEIIEEEPQEEEEDAQEQLEQDIEMEILEKHLDEEPEEEDEQQEDEEEEENSLTLDEAIERAERMAEEEASLASQIAEIKAMPEEEPFEEPFEEPQEEVAEEVQEEEIIDEPVEEIIEEPIEEETIEDEAQERNELFESFNDDEDVESQESVGFRRLANLVVVPKEEPKPTPPPAAPAGRLIIDLSKEELISILGKNLDQSMIQNAVKDVLKGSLEEVLTQIVKDEIKHIKDGE